MLCVFIRIAEKAVVNEPPVFEPLKFYSIILDYHEKTCLPASFMQQYTDESVATFGIIAWVN